MIEIVRAFSNELKNNEDMFWSNLKEKWQAIEMTDPIKEMYGNE